MMATARPVYTDPPYLDPFARPLVAPVPQALARPSVELPQAEPLTPADDLSQPVPEAQPAPADRSGPQLGTPNLAGALEVAVTAPPRKQVGSAVEFLIEVRNTSEQTAENVAVDVEFDEPLVFPGSRERRVAQPLGRLAPGESKEVTLSLVAERVGTDCVRLLATVSGREAGWKSVCVEVVPKQLQLEIVGPPRRTVGSRAEFNVKLVNASTQPLRGAQATVRYDAALTPREGSAGARQKPGSMSWDLGGLQPGEGVQLQIEFECRIPAESACLSAEVTGANFPTERLEKCISVVSLEGSVDVQAMDRLDPLKVGDETEYLVTVQNRDLRAVRDLRLEAEIPAQIQFLSADVTQNDQPLPVNAELQEAQVVFEPIEALAPDAVLTYRIRVKATTPGDGAFVARLTHADSLEPVEVIEPTTVIRR
jgi:hypothetical protein